MKDEVKLLIVDDEPRNLDALEAMLESSGCTLIRAASSDEALLAMLQHQFAAMVFDIRMPGMSGIELARLVKQRKRTRDVPILFLTAHLVDDDDVLRGYDAGAVDYLSKPVNADILRSKIGVFVDLYKKTRALATLNDTLQNEIGERRNAQEALQQANQELELRVRERTAALTIAHNNAVDNEERLRTAMDIARMAAWEWDLAISTVTWSTDPEALFGFPPGSFGPERRIINVVHRDDQERVHRAVEAAFAGHGYECEYRVARPNGSIVWIAERGRVLKDGDGLAVKFVGFSRDISTQREAEFERERLLSSERRARDEAERQSRIKDEFLATLSHELRTPMNTILGWLNLLNNGQAPDAEQALRVIERNAKAQARLIEDLLQMNLLSLGTARLELSSVDVRAAIESAAQNLQPAATAKRITIDVNVEHGLPAMTADSGRVQQILWNLLHNAVKFTPHDGCVGVRANHLDGIIRIVVSDNGSGIPPDFLPHVFERFRQADSSPTRRTFGLGLGLSIAKHLVELHGGSIEAASDGLGRGASFTVDLPVRLGTRAAVQSSVISHQSSVVSHQSSANEISTDESRQIH